MEAKNLEIENEVSSSLDQQYISFMIDGDLYGVSVLDVQEIIKPMQVTEIPLTDPRISGLVNLRGIIVTTISLRQLYKMEELPDEQEYMNVIVKTEDGLVALKVDEIRDVIQVGGEGYEKPPETLSPNVKPFVSCIHKLEKHLLVVLDLEKILNFSVG